MGSLTIPANGLVYVDAQAVIYSVEKHPIYSPLLRPLWAAVKPGTLEVATSELTILECLVGPLKLGNVSVVVAFEQFFQLPGIRLLPITAAILRDAARLRADIGKLKTPDAIHAATAIQNRCVQLVTNDAAFRAIGSVPVIMLNDLIAKP